MANDRNILIFRDLEENEIECRIAQATEKGVALLLYKDARCDMNILDETVGAFNWKREHSRENANCVVSIWDDGKQQWISKEDTGTESNTEAAKGLASDSFKRACFNWGIGRELYTAPFIWVPADKCATLKKDQNGRYKCYDRFRVTGISIQDKKITGLTVYSDKLKEVVFSFGSVVDYREALKKYITEHGLNQQDIVTACKLNAMSSQKQYKAALEYAKENAR